MACNRTINRFSHYLLYSRIHSDESHRLPVYEIFAGLHAGFTAYIARRHHRACSLPVSPCDYRHLPGLVRNPNARFGKDTYVHYHRAARISDIIEIIPDSNGASEMKFNNFGDYQNF